MEEPSAVNPDDDFKNLVHTSISEDDDNPSCSTILKKKTVVMHEDDCNPSTETLDARIRRQIEYYFSNENLQNDKFLRRIMNSNGWVPVGVVCEFPRAKLLCQNMDMIIKSVSDSSNVELSADGTLMRTKITPEKWPIVTQLKADAPEFVPRIESEVIRPASTSCVPVAKLRTITPKVGSREHRSSSASEHRNTHYKNTRRGASATGEPDTVFDDAMSIPGYVSAASGPSTAGKAASQRDPGSDKMIQTNKNMQCIDQSTSNVRNEKLLSVKSTLVVSDVIPSSSSSTSHSLHAAPRNRPLSNRKHANSMSATHHRSSWLIHGCVVDVGHTSRRLLASYNSLDWTAYITYHDRCINERDKMGPGKSFEMATLYRFWAQALRIRYYVDWYKEFKALARTDAAVGYRYGLECLFYFYSYSLEKNFMNDIYRDFEIQTIEDYESGHLYGLEKFWAFLKYSKRNVVINWKIQGWLNTFQRMEDFRGARLRPIEYGSHTNLQEVHGPLTNLHVTQGYAVDSSDSSLTGLRERTYSLPSRGVPQFNLKSQNVASVTGISVGLDNHGYSNAARSAEMVTVTGRW